MSLDHPFGDMDLDTTQRTETERAYKDYAAAGKEAGFFALPKKGRVLEIGFGSGKLLEALCDHDNDVYGVDVSEALVQSARDMGFDQVELLDISENALPYPDDFFDAVFCYEVFEHLTNPHRLFFEVRRVLKKEHKLYFSVPAQEIDMGYGAGRHTFVYPGLMERENLERFIMQMYFSIEQYVKPGPHDHLLGHSYVLVNKKSAGKPDVVEVVIQDCNVGDLYGDLLPPDRLSDEIETEVQAHFQIAEECFQRDDIVSAVSMLNYVLGEYPGHGPLYPRLLDMALANEQTEMVRQVLDFVKTNIVLSPEIRDQLKAVVAARTA